MPLRSRAVGFTAALSLRRVWYWALVVGAYGALPVLIGATPWVERFERFDLASSHRASGDRHSCCICRTCRGLWRVISNTSGASARSWQGEPPYTTNVEKLVLRRRKWHVPRADPLLRCEGRARTEPRSWKRPKKRAGTQEGQENRRPRRTTGPRGSFPEFLRAFSNVAVEPKRYRPKRTSSRREHQRRGVS